MLQISMHSWQVWKYKNTKSKVQKIDTYAFVQV